MLPNIGTTELVIIGLIALLLFGAKRLPEIGQSLGKSIRMFKKSVKDIQEELPRNDELYREDRPASSKTYSADTSAEKDRD
ncbi:MAG: twin-arginine translocase TatA/TatE family subunit [Candidatus Glassbacteria bacterium]|nr:twin-arginine translocase TatA/TatE family subunit [Candidatus Glassbacteria bacterium]